MSDEKLRQLLSTLPPEDEIADRAERARHQALARLEEPAPARPGWVWAPASALSIALIAGALWAAKLWRVQPLVWSPPTPQIASAPLRPPAPTPPPARQVAHRQAPTRILAQKRLQVHWVLSDGTQVEWTFDKDFSL